MDVANYWFSSGAAAGGFEIANSLRFRGGQDLTWTPSVNDTDRDVKTLSFWVKRGALSGTGGGIFDARNSSTNYTDILFSNTSPVDALRFRRVNASSTISNIHTSGIYRDASAWYHVVFVYDSTQAAGPDRGKWFINGEFVAHDNANQIELNQDDNFGRNGCPQRWGRSQSLGGYLEGYLAEIHCLDGTAVADASDFGEYNADGVWVPKEVTGVTYGTNGYYLDFSDPADIGADRSGNGNNFTPTGFDTSIDANSEDYRNPILLNARTQTYQGATKTFAFNEMTFGAVYSSSRKEGMNALTTLELPKSGKWYIPMQDQYNGYSGSVYRASGLWLCKKSDQTTFSWNPTTSGNSPDDRPFIGRGKNYTWGNTNRSFVQGNVPGILMSNSNPTSRELANDNGTPNYTPVVYFLDCDAGEGYVAVAVGGSISFTTGTGLSDTAHMTWDVNEDYLIGFWLMGMDNAVGNRTFRLAADSADLIDTATVPAGYELLSMPNLPNVSITDPSNHFTTILDTGANILTNAQAQVPNGLWMIKDRVNTNNWQFLDSLRGGTDAWTSPGDGVVTYSAPAGNSLAYCWATPASHVNTTAGFQILSYSGNETARTISHSLGAEPAMIWTKATSGSNINISESTYHVGTGLGQYGRLNSGLIYTDAQSFTGVSSTDFSLGTSFETNGNGRNYTAYLWTPIPGYSAFGSYQGNNNQDGVFIYLGFRPALIATQSIGASPGNSFLWRSAEQSPYNPVRDVGFTSETNLQQRDQIDFLSNGFKARCGGGVDDGSGTNQSFTYLYLAFAEHPFGGGNVSPSPAR